MTSTYEPRSAVRMLKLIHEGCRDCLVNFPSVVINPAGRPQTSQGLLELGHGPYRSDIRAAIDADRRWRIRENGDVFSWLRGRLVFPYRAYGLSANLIESSAT